MKTKTKTNKQTNKQKQRGEGTENLGAGCQLQEEQQMLNEYRRRTQMLAYQCLRQA